MPLYKYFIFPLTFIITWLWLLFDHSIWFRSIVFIREAIRSGDSGLIILASVLLVLLQALPIALLFIALEISISEFDLAKRSKWLPFSLHCLNAIVFYGAFRDRMSFVGILGSLALALLLLNFSRMKETRSSRNFPIALIVLQVFLAMHWLIILLPQGMLSLPVNELWKSLHRVVAYLESQTTFSFIGFTFFIPFLSGAVLTALLYRTQSVNTLIIAENYEKASAIEAMRTTLMANRLYQEIHTLAHDLKTPLVTIRGLNSLMQENTPNHKRTLYQGRIEGAIEKMNEMITSFLYADAKASIAVDALLRYVRAQLPIEDDFLEIEETIQADLPNIHINQVRMARAVVNIIENAILAPMAPEVQVKKLIQIKAEKWQASGQEGIRISISDNGIGVPESAMQKIWEIGHSSRNTSGLGLPFARQVVIEHNGDILLSSTYGKGTTVQLWLPVMPKD